MTLLDGTAGELALGDEWAIRAVDEIFRIAIAARASDVHVEPWDGAGRVRIRVDGRLRECRALSTALLPRVLSRLKLLAGMDIADRRSPQDGRYTLVGSGIDARVASIPTVAGEKVAVRLLEDGARIASLRDLGMDADVAARFSAACSATHGIVIACGPTGSGKTTTLYAALAERNRTDQHLCSVEDPVEVRIPGIVQIQVNVRAGLTFSAGLRALVRQDPDAIAIGELRDAETTAVAASAALCGQLILTTIHATNALTAIERLGELGIAPRRLAAGLRAIVSQRLVRRLCDACKLAAPLVDGVPSLGLQSGASAFEAPGCEQCSGSGYRGRVGVFELLAMTPAFVAAVAGDAKRGELAALARAGGYEPMRRAAGALVAAGMISVGEALQLPDETAV